MDKVKSSLLFVGVVFFASLFLFGAEAAAMGRKKVPAMGKKKVLGPQYFALNIATLDGKKIEEVVKDPRREMNHVRVSEDMKWVTFTRFNEYNKSGYAMEEHEGTYTNTEVVICRTDGKDLQSIVPPKKKFVNANSYWTSDGTGIIYISSENAKRRPEIKLVNVGSRKITSIPTPAHLFPTDPSIRGNVIVYPAKRRKLPTHRIWIMNSDGTGARQLSRAGRKAGQENDPKISPDGTQVAFMRYQEGGIRNGVHLIVADINTGAEKDLSGAGSRNIDAMPEWSSDGKLLVFWHRNRRDKKKHGIYVIRPDGTGRRKVPLPDGYSYTMPAFLPGTGSGDNAKIIYSARKL